MNAGRATMGAGIATIAGLAVISGCARSVEVPDVRDMTVAEAVSILTEEGFDAVVVGDHEVDDVADWTVDSHSLRGELQPQGETIRINANSVLHVASTACDAGRVGDGGRSLVLDMEGEDAGSGDLALVDTMCVLDELDVPDVVLDKMGSTRSLDGRQEDDWNEIEASWSYHPDDGLDVILELE